MRSNEQGVEFSCFVELFIEHLEQRVERLGTDRAAGDRERHKERHRLVARLLQPGENPPTS